jgi:acyl-[acyl-carrier-protein]-phospholipid O-acyltransferase/long-chain-fatty-acid--[acyl-carrier-protein] ligase
VLLHQQFIRTAKAHADRPAIIDRTTGTRLSYGRTLVASLILTEKFKECDPGFIGIMLPTSAGCILSVLASLMSGRTPVMINYSTGAAQNCDYARKKCGFTTIITSRALLKKLNIEPLPGMIFIEELMKQITGLDKVRAKLRSLLPLPLLLRGVHNGSDDENAVVLFTSGSERDPKAVLLTHRNIAANLAGIAGVIKLSADEIREWITHPTEAAGASTWVQRSASLGERPLKPTSRSMRCRWIPASSMPSPHDRESHQRCFATATRSPRDWRT